MIFLANRYTRSTAANLAHIQLPLNYLYDPSTPVCSYFPVIDIPHLYDPSTPVCSYVPIIDILTADDATIEDPGITSSTCSIYHTHPPDHIVAEAQSSMFKQASYVHLNRDYMITAWLNSLSLSDDFHSLQSNPISTCGEVDSCSTSTCWEVLHSPPSSNSSLSSLHDIQSVSHPDNVLHIKATQPAGAVMAT
jgi:hypothetical protein